MGKWVNVVAFRYDVETQPIIFHVDRFDTKGEAQASQRKAKDQTEREGVVGRVIANSVRLTLTIDKVDAQQGRHLQRTNQAKKVRTAGITCDKRWMQYGQEGSSARQALTK